MNQNNFAEPVIEQRQAMEVAAVRREVPMEQIPEFYDSSFPKLFAALQAAGQTPSAAPMGVSYGQPQGTLDLAVAVPVTEKFSDAGEVVGLTLPSARTALLTVRGDYNQLPAAYDYLRNWVTDQGLEPAGWAWEQYLTEPAPDADPQDNVTLIGMALAD